MVIKEGEQGLRSDANNPLVSTILHLQGAFIEIERIHRRLHNPEHQARLDGCFGRSATRIMAIGAIEERTNKDGLTPLFKNWFHLWHRKKDIIERKGYAIKTFEDYLEEKREKREKRAERKASRRSL